MCCWCHKENSLQTSSPIPWWNVHCLFLDFTKIEVVGVIPFQQPLLWPVIRRPIRVRSLRSFGTSGWTKVTASSCDLPDFGRWTWKVRFFKNCTLDKLILSEFAQPGNHKDNRSVRQVYLACLETVKGEKRVYAMDNLRSAIRLYYADDLSATGVLEERQDSLPTDTPRCPPLRRVWADVQ